MIISLYLLVLWIDPMVKLRLQEREICIAYPRTWQFKYRDNTDAWQRLATYSTCVFGVKTFYPYYVKIGNDDIADLIVSSTQMFRRKITGVERVGAEGNTLCPTASGNGGDRTGWAIFHT